MLRKHKLLKTKSSHVKAGMTLVELIVVLSIFAVISTIVIINYNDSKSRASLYNLAEDIGLSIRRAQSRAIGIQVTDIAGAEQSKGYGIHFSTGQGSVTGNNKSIVFFTDLVCTGDTPNKEYDYPGKPDMQVFPCNPNPSTTPVCDRANLGPGNECIDIINITSTDTVSALCINAPDEICSQQPGEVSSLDIVFVRPNPDAYFCYTQPVPSGGLSAPCVNSGISNAEIVVKSQAGDTKTITVWNTGQISVK